MEIKNCILVTLSISQWDANSLDRVVSQAVATANGVKDQRMCRLRKSLLPRTAVLNQLKSSARAARSYHYENTHAWVHEGPRILTRTNYDQYMRQMTLLKSDFNTCVLDFLAQYSELKADAQDALGDLYKESDYPTLGFLEQSHSFNVGVLPMPVASTLLEFGLDENEASALKARLEGELSATFTKANTRMWDDLYSRLKKVSDKLEDNGAHVQDVTIEGLRKLAETVPRINLTSDAELEAVALHLSETLEGVTSSGLKVNPVLRGRVTKALAVAVIAMDAAMARRAAALHAPAVAPDRAVV